MPDDFEDNDPAPDPLWSPPAPREEGFQSLLGRLSDARRRMTRGARYWYGPMARRRSAAQVALLQQELALLRTTATLPESPWDQQAEAEELEAERQRFIAEIEAIAERGRQQQESAPDPGQAPPTRH